MRSRYVIAILLLLLVAVFGLKKVWTSGRVDASSLLLDSARKAHHTDYSGLVETSTMYYGRKLNGLTRVYHKGSGDRMEYLSTPAKGAVVVSNENETITYHPATGRMTVSPSVAQAEEEHKVKLLLKNYSTRTAGEETVAGRPALIVDVVPKRSGNPSKRVWIDRDNHMVLKQESRSSTGALKSRMLFREISFSANIPAEKFKKPEDVRQAEMRTIHQPMQPEVLGRRVGFKVVKPGYVPAGYEFAGYQLYHCQCKCSHNAAHLRYTDGLNSISIFETPLSVHCAGSACKTNQKKMKHGCEVGDCRQAQVGRVHLKDKTIVVIADLPHDEIERIAGSIK